MTSQAALAGTSEKDWQQWVVTCARWNGWMSFHPFDSRRSTAGFPDLVLIRDGDLIVAELKTARGRVTIEQQAWLDAFAGCGVDAVVWRPADQDEVITRLGRRRTKSAGADRSAVLAAGLRAIVEAVSTAHASRADRRPGGGAVTRCEVEVERIAQVALARAEALR